MKAIFLTLIVFLLFNLSKVLAQDNEIEQIFLVVSNNDTHWKNLLFVSQKGNKILDKHTGLNKGKPVELIIWYVNDEEKNFNYILNSDSSNNVIQIENKTYRVDTDGKNIQLKETGRLPASVNDMNFKIEKIMFTSIKCKNHNPPHVYSDINNISKNCCFVTNCIK